MRILVESSTYHCQNMGDLAMMLVAVDRIRQLCPEASIRMLTAAPDSLNRLFHGVVPVSAQARSQWVNSHSLLGGYAQRPPSWFAHRLRSLEDRLWAAAPNAFGTVIRMQRKIAARPRTDPSQFVREIQDSDLLVVTGMGTFNDSFADHALTLLDVLALALRCRIPIALLGQGIGPITDSQLLHRAKEVFPQARFIGLRESEIARPLLHSLGVSPSRVEFTGDDALELAHARRPQILGTGLGVNLRLATYSGVDQKVLDPVRKVLDRVALDLGIPLVPLPSSFREGESGVGVLKQLAAGMSSRWEGDLQLEDPIRVIEQTSRCRVVVTGSYHPAVFALAQGISVVCLEHSPYYSGKFGGLHSQFGDACRVVPMGQADFAGRLEEAIRATWNDAPDRRQSLLEATAALVARGRSAYARLFRELGCAAASTAQAASQSQ